MNFHWRFFFTIEALHDMHDAKITTVKNKRGTRAAAATNAEQPAPCLRSHRLRVTHALSPELEFALARWQKKARHLATDPRAFLSWLLTRKAVVSSSAHRRALDHQRADLAGEVQMLVRVGGVKREAVELTFTDGSKIVGAAEVVPEALPIGIRQGEILLLTLSHPKCAACGHTNERACAGGCTWVAPDLCSKCARQRRRKS